VGPTAGVRVTAEPERAGAGPSSAGLGRAGAVVQRCTGRARSDLSREGHALGRCDRSGSQHGGRFRRCSRHRFGAHLRGLGVHLPPRAPVAEFPEPEGDGPSCANGTTPAGLMESRIPRRLEREREGGKGEEFTRGGMMHWRLG
jgi:hypothetical protein